MTPQENYIEESAMTAKGNEGTRFGALMSFLSGEKFLHMLAKTIFILLLPLMLVFLFVFCLYLAPRIQEKSPGRRVIVASPPESDIRKSKEYKKRIALLSKDVQALVKKYQTYTPRQPYLIINTTDNRFFLYKNQKLVRKGFCSSGSYTLLQSHGKRQWIFKTPKGQFRIRGKTTNPVWRRPDWSFVEEGLPVPSANDPSRWEYGVLGDYAMAIGNGYLIHGTIYKRFLGMPVTHGCIRLNDEDLEAVFYTLDIGSRVYIY